MFTLVIEKTIAINYVNNISLSKKFELPFVPFIGLIIIENGKEYVVSDRLVYNIDYGCFATSQFENSMKRNLDVQSEAEKLKPFWDTVNIVKY